MKYIKFIALFILLICTSLLADAQLVYKTPNGAKYHLASCRMVKNASEKITVSKAQKLGLGPCKICNPPASPGAQSVKAGQGQTTTVQCKGVTKTGNRCLHKTSIGNGYCYQHQPG